VIFVSGALNGLLALVSLLLAAGSFYMYKTSEKGIWIVGLIVFAVLLVVFGAMFLSGRVNKTEEIHITE
jgi:hypothetical protein